MGGGPESVCARNMSSYRNFNTLHCCIKLAFRFISWWRCTVKQLSGILFGSQAFFQDLIHLLLGTYLFFLSQDIVGVILTRLQAGKSKSNHSFSNMDRRFSPKVSRPAPGPTHPPIEWALEVHSPELQWPECKAGHLLPPNAGVKNEWGTSSPICLACTWMTLCLNVFGTDSMTRFYWIFLCLESFQTYKRCTVQ